MPRARPSHTTAERTALLPPLQENVFAPWLAQPQVRARAWLLASLGVFLAGYFLMYNGWIQDGWLVIGVLPTVALASGYSQFKSLWRNPFMLSALAFLAWMIGVSWVRYPVTFQDGEAWSWLAGVAFLLVFGLAVWMSADWFHGMHQMGKTIVFSALFAAIGSAIIFHGFDAYTFAGSRLRNWFVYGGLNSVCTGLTFGFASMWAACVWDRDSSPRKRAAWLAAQALLTLAVMFTLSRGALLALVCGHLVSLFVRGWRGSRVSLLVFAGVVVGFQLGVAPVVAVIAEKHLKAIAVEQGMNPAEVKLPALGSVSKNPAKEWVNRADNGRLPIYMAGLSTLRTPGDVIMGAGLWNSDDWWKCGFNWEPEHLHSIFVATLVHGGAVGLILLLTVLGLGTQRAWFMARNGEPLWLILLAFGVGGLLFDGQSLCSLRTLPRIEPLLIWFPLIVAVRQAAALKEWQQSEV